MSNLQVTLLPPINIFNRTQRERLSVPDLLALRLKEEMYIKKYGAIEKVFFVAMSLTALVVAIIASTQTNQNVTNIFIIIDAGIIVIATLAIITAIVNWTKQSHMRRFEILEKELTNRPGEVELIEY